jgi:adenylate kinase family enzyme
MARAVVVGNGGGGKSTLARALAERHDLVCCLLGNL